MTNDYRINIFYSVDDKGYVADFPDLKHCSAIGETPQEALEELLKAKEALEEAIAMVNPPWEKD